jgi:hypothetical protein
MKAIVKQVSCNGKFGIFEVTEISGNRFDIGVNSMDVLPVGQRYGGKLAIGQRYDLTFTIDLTSGEDKDTI